MVIPSSPDEQPIAGDDGSLAVASSKESQVADDATAAERDAAAAAADATGDTESTKAVSGGGDDQELGAGRRASAASENNNSCRGWAGSSADRRVKPCDERHSLTTGNANGHAATEAPDESPVAAAADDGDGSLLAPASDGGLVAHDDDGVLETASPANRNPMKGRSYHRAKASSVEGRCSLVDDGGASEESFSSVGGGGASDGKASSNERSNTHAVASSSSSLSPSETAKHQQGFHRSAPPLPRAAAVAAKRGDLFRGEVEKIEKEAANPGGRNVAKGVTASARPGGQKCSKIMAATPVGSPLHAARLQKLRLRTKPPEGWECEPEGLCLKRQAEARKMGVGETAATAVARWSEPQKGKKTSV